MCSCHNEILGNVKVYIDSLPMCCGFEEYCNPCGLDITVSKSDIVEYGTSNGSINLLIEGANEPYTISWEAITILNNNGVEGPLADTTPYIGSLYAGRYRAIVIDSKECKAEVVVDIHEAANPCFECEGATSTCCTDSVLCERLTTIAQEIMTYIVSNGVANAITIVENTIGDACTGIGQIITANASTQLTDCNDDWSGCYLLEMLPYNQVAESVTQFNIINVNIYPVGCPYSDYTYHLFILVDPLNPNTVVQQIAYRYNTFGIYTPYVCLSSTPACIEFGYPGGIPTVVPGNWVPSNACV